MTTEDNTHAENPPTSDPKPLGFWLRTVDALLSQEFATAFDGTGTSRRDWMILNILSGDVDAAGFAERLARKGKRLGGLAERGWVEQQGDGTWTITEEGRAAQARLGELVEGIRSRVAGAVSPEDFATTLASLEAIARELGWDENAPKVRRGFRSGFGPGFGPWRGRGGLPGREGFPGRGGFPVAGASPATPGSARRPAARHPSPPTERSAMATATTVTTASVRASAPSDPNSWDAPRTASIRAPRLRRAVPDTGSARAAGTVASSTGTVASAAARNAPTSAASTRVSPAGAPRARHPTPSDRSDEQRGRDPMGSRPLRACSGGPPGRRVS